MIRLGPGTEVRMGELQDRRYLVQVAVGTTTFRVLANSSPRSRSARRPFRFILRSPEVIGFPCKRTGRPKSRYGRAKRRFFSPRGSEVLHAGQTMQARGNASDPEFQIVAAIPRDEWDQWNERRDQVLQRATTSSRYVGPEVTGTADLDTYGQWQYDPAYGQVWVPTVSAGWAPYREGRWVYVDYYGWSWLSGDPWGWGPYHYGNWYQGSFGWAWYPGPYSAITTGGPRWSDSSDGAAEEDSAAGLDSATWAGCLWLRLSDFIRGTGAQFQQHNFRQQRDGEQFPQCAFGEWAQRRHQRERRRFQPRQNHQLE